MRLHKKIRKEAKEELTSFKEFVVDTNLMSLAIGILVGTSFRGVILAVINEMIMPNILGASIEAYELWGMKMGIVFAALIEFTVTLITIYFVFKLFKRIGLHQPKKKTK